MKHIKTYELITQDILNININPNDLYKYIPKYIPGGEYIAIGNISLNHNNDERYPEYEYSLFNYIHKKNINSPWNTNFLTRNVEIPISDLDLRLYVTKASPEEIETYNTLATSQKYNI